MKVPLVKPNYNGNELKYLTNCIKSGWVSSQGKYVKKFEDKFAKFCGTKYAISCSSGTSALHLSLLAYGIGPGDEVIIPDLSFVATGNAVLYVGATPVLVDISKGSFNINTTLLESKITKRTKAIIAVHLYGRPCYMARILDIAKERDLIIIEDAAEAHGAFYGGKRVGSIGNAGCFSFFGNKIITTGEGGMITTNDKNINERVRFLRDHGMSKTRRFWHPEVGYNYRMTNLQAAVGVAQLERIDKFIQNRVDSGLLYDKYLDSIHDVLDYPFCLMHYHNVFWMFPLVIKNKSGSYVMKKLYEKGIDSRPFFYPFHQLPAFKEFSKGSFLVSEYVSKHGICLPTHSPRKVRYVCDCLKSILRNRR